MRILATCLLLIYLSVSCRPAFPVLADGLAHLLWYESHVETVHLHDGSMHVHSEIAGIAAEDFGDQSQTPTPAKSFKITDFVAAHLVAEIQFFNIPFWDIQSAGLPVSARVLVGLYSKKVLVPPPDGRQPAPHGLTPFSQKPLPVETPAIYLGPVPKPKTTHPRQCGLLNHSLFTTHNAPIRNGLGPYQTFFFSPFYFTVTV